MIIFNTTVQSHIQDVVRPIGKWHLRVNIIPPFQRGPDSPWIAPAVRSDIWGWMSVICRLASRNSPSTGDRSHVLFTARSSLPIAGKQYLNNEQNGVKTFISLPVGCHYMPFLVKLSSEHSPIPMVGHQEIQHMTCLRHVSVII